MPPSLAEDASRVVSAFVNFIVIPVENDSWWICAYVYAGRTDAGGNDAFTRLEGYREKAPEKGQREEGYRGGSLIALCRG